MYNRGVASLPLTHSHVVAQTALRSIAGLPLLSVSVVRPVVRLAVALAIPTTGR